MQNIVKRAAKKIAKKRVAQRATKWDHRRAEVAIAIAAGKSVAEVAKSIGMGPTNLYPYLRRWGIELPPAGERAARPETGRARAEAVARAIATRSKKVGRKKKVAAASAAPQQPPTASPTRRRIKKVARKSQSQSQSLAQRSLELSDSFYGGSPTGDSPIGNSPTDADPLLRDLDVSDAFLREQLGRASQKRAELEAKLATALQERDAARLALREVAHAVVKRREPQ